LYYIPRQIQGGNKLTTAAIDTVLACPDFHFD